MLYNISANNFKEANNMKRTFTAIVSLLFVAVLTCSCQQGIGKQSAGYNDVYAGQDYLNAEISGYVSEILPGAVSIAEVKRGPQSGETVLIAAFDETAVFMKHYAYTQMYKYGLKNSEIVIFTPYPIYVASDTATSCELSEAWAGGRLSDDEIKIIYHNLLVAGVIAEE